jgi:branched-chain amino acid transport system permease protein
MIELTKTNHYYYFTMVLFLLTIAVCWIIINSPFGSVLRAIRENPNRAEYLGIKVKNFQLMIFVFASMVAGFAGALVGPFERSIFPDLAYWTTSGEAAFMAILGGIYTFIGPMIGAFILIFLQDIIRSNTEYWLVFVGGILIPLVIFLPGGVMGFVQSEFQKYAPKRKTQNGNLGNQQSE